MGAAERAVVVTGASSGIGEQCALRLAGEGYRVFATVRRAEDGERLVSRSPVGITPLLMDVTDEGSVQAAAKEVAGHLDGAALWGLVNNAGVAVGGPLEFLPPDALREQLNVNVVGQVAVTQAFLPMLRRARGRVVNIGSVSGRVAFPLLGPYCASKFAMEALSAVLRMELAPWGIHVALVEAAGIATPIWSKSVEAGQRLAERMPAEAMQLYGPLVEAQQRRASRSGTHGLPVELVVRAVAHALGSNRPRTRYRVGRVALVGEILRLLPTPVREKLIRRQMGW
jgi:NAD(P)-dependent dehydrogenase (short-subunit alcohol dehydrogenase family)